MGFAINKVSEGATQMTEVSELKHVGLYVDQYGDLLLIAIGDDEKRHVVDIAEMAIYPQRDCMWNAREIQTGETFQIVGEG